MITKEDEYMSNAYKVAGFSLMIPIGQFFLNLPDLNLNDFTNEYVIYIVVSFALFCLGIIIVLTGAMILRRKENIK